MKDAFEHEANESMNKAAVEEHSEKGLESTEIAECKAMFDGTWRKRGYSSLQGAVTCISAATGKCLDYETLYQACISCSRWAKKPISAEKERWEGNHVCPINFAGSAPAMEPEGVRRIFLRSSESRHLQYTGYIGDGDSKAFSQVNSLRPYGDKSITKIECVGHVQKRMGTALRKLKSAKGKQKLSDRKTIDGAGILTGALIDKRQIY